MLAKSNRIERRNVRELLARIDGLPLSVKVGVAHPVRVIVTAIGVAQSSKAILGVRAATGVSVADVILVILARVRSEREGV